jgi:uncharacterized membrane protein YkvA (DUF1232 family)
MKFEKGLPVKGYYEMLQDNVRDYNGKFHEVIKYAPDLFKLFTNLLEDPTIPSKSKHLINATIAYFVAPFDAFPEEVYGAVGYLDDLFLCAWALKKLEEEVGYAALANNWQGEEELSSVIDDVYKKSKNIIQDMEQDILEYVGLEGY